MRCCQSGQVQDCPTISTSYRFPDAAWTSYRPPLASRETVTDAEERLSRVEDVDAVTIDKLHSIDPKLSTTVITVEITVRWTATMTDEEISDRLTEVSGLESIQRVG